MGVRRKPQAKWKSKGGDPHINLCLTVLLAAKRDTTQMWQDFIKEYKMTGQNYWGFDTAQWVCWWWKRDLAGKIIYGDTEPKEAPSRF